jgi:dipeptidyl aminopeptidase/acylaminoacyl peptidase
MNDRKPADGTIVEIAPLESPDPGFCVREITYMSDGLRVKGCLVQPVPVPASGWPPMMYLRGGIRAKGMVRVERMITLARRGRAVFAPYYRGNRGGEGTEDFAGEDRYDAYHALAVFRQLDGIRPEPVPLLGFSRGAIMALLTARDCDGVGPVAVWGGVSDLWLTYVERADLRRMLRRVVGHPHKDAEAYFRRSPVCWARDIRPPVMIVHGTRDEQVGVEHAYRLERALTAAGKPPFMHIAGGMGHVFAPEEDARALDLVFAWFRDGGRTAAAGSVSGIMRIREANDERKL